jgi:hypothetical protein
MISLVLTHVSFDSRRLETQTNDYQTQIDVLVRERSSLMEHINQLAQKSDKHHVECQTDSDSYVIDSMIGTHRFSLSLSLSSIFRCSSTTIR